MLRQCQVKAMLRDNLIPSNGGLIKGGKNYQSVPSLRHANLPPSAYKVLYGIDWHYAVDGG